jgi:hypothetical protein
MIIVADWQTSIPLTARTAGLVNIDVRERTTDHSSSLGFFPLGVFDGKAGLLLRFGFYPPTGDIVAVRLLEVFRREGTRDYPFAIGPSMRRVKLLRLSGAYA